MTAWCSRRPGAGVTASPSHETPHEPAVLVGDRGSLHRSRDRLAEAFNALVLPLIAVFLWLTMNDREFLGGPGVNTRLQNLVVGVVVLVCAALGLRVLVPAAGSALAMLW